MKKDELWREIMRQNPHWEGEFKMNKDTARKMFDVVWDTAEEFGIRSQVKSETWELLAEVFNARR